MFSCSFLTTPSPRPTNKLAMSLAPVPCTTGGGGRAVTPDITRSASGNARTNSATKARARAIAEFLTDVPTKRHISRAKSHRKQRQWENKNLFGLFAQEAELYYSLEDQDDRQDTLDDHQFYIQWRSNLSQLFDQSNKEALESFRTCQPLIESLKNSTRKIRQGEWQTAEEAWFGCEKKIRTVISQTLQSMKKKTIMAIEELEHILLKAIDLKGKFEKTGLQSVPNSSITLDKSGNLIFMLQDSSFHRLLLHGVCQFYGVHSKSIIKKLVKTNKLTVVYLPKEEISRTVKGRVSISAYLSALFNIEKTLPSTPSPTMIKDDEWTVL